MAATRKSSEGVLAHDQPVDEADDIHSCFFFKMGYRDAI